jgi:DNA-directed RNA polymerase specialized sigma24 family protein
MIDETVRLYSKPSRVAADVVAEQHQAVHGDLDRWGRWNRERTQSRGCASAESVYEKYRTPGATIQEVDLRSVAIERAVLHLPLQHRDTVRLFYVQRISPNGICRVFSLRYEAFPEWMFGCRSMVLNILRRHGA